MRVSRMCFVAVVAVGLGFPATASDEASRLRLLRDELVPLLRTYCFDCHGETDGEGDVSLAADATPDAVVANREIWNRALTQVQLGSMPPADGDLMDAATRARMVALIDEVANAINCVRHPNAGKVAMRRLNRIEYRNTIRDLTGVDYAPAADFPGDDVGYGFDNIGDVLSLPPVLMEKYLKAAEAITGIAIYTPPPPRLFELDRDPASLIGAEKHHGKRDLTIASNATVTLSTKIPFAGEFKVTVVASGDQGGNEPVKLQIQSSGQTHLIEVPETDPAEKTISFRLGKGKRTIDIAFVNDAYVPGRIDRNLHLHHVSIRGVERQSKFASRPQLPASHRKIIFQRPDGSRSAIQATKAVMGRFSSRA
ncbi:MAG: DUF1587 domain-containing protein, partial [Planctomycetota bacterium]